MGGDPIPGLHEPLVKWFSAWKTRLRRAAATVGSPHVTTKKGKSNYLHGNVNRYRRERSR